MRVTLVHNPGAGDDGQVDAAQLVRLVEGQGHTVRYQSAAGAWAAALAAPADLVAIAGGDGTVARVAKALVGRGMPFTVLPMGTANNISKTLGLTELPLAALVGGWEAGQHVAFDVAIARGPWGRRHFLEGFGAGLFAWTLPEADCNKTLETLNDGEARLAYALQLLRDGLEHCAPRALSVRVDGRDLSGEYVLFEAMNIHYVGPSLYLAPAGDLADGMLDVLLVPEADRDILGHYLASWQNGMSWPADLPTCRARRVELEWTGYPVHLDDWVWPAAGGDSPAAPARIELTVESRALEFLLPAAPA